MRLWLVIVTIVPVLAAGAGFLAWHDVLTARQEAAAAATQTQTPSLAIAPEDLEAQAAVIYDPATRALWYDKNAEAQYPLASLTKLMATDAALGDISPTTTVVIAASSATNIQDEGDLYLRPGDTWNAQNLITYALLVSSNNAIIALAGALGDDTLLAQMNAKAKELGLVQTYFLDPTGLDLTTGVSGAYGSARDVAVLAADFYRRYPSYFESTLNPEVSLPHMTPQMASAATALPILDIPGLIGAKTGYTDLAGGNLVVVFDVTVDHPLVAVALHSTQTGRFSDIRTLIEAARQTYKQIYNE